MSFNKLVSRSVSMVTDLMGFKNMAMTVMN